MFYSFFIWFCDRMVDIFNQFKTFPLFQGFTYFNFVIFLFAVPMFIRIINFIMGIEDEEPLFRDKYTSRYDKQYDFNSHKVSNNYQRDFYKNE